MILITQPRVGKSHNEILALQMAARVLNWEVLPSTYGWRLDEELIKTNQSGTPYGSWTFCEVIAQQMNWTLKRNNFNWLAKLPLKYTKRQVDFMSLGEAKLINQLKFIKPADDKCFDAKVYEPGTFKPHQIINDDYPTLVSDVVKFDYEYRCFVKDRKVLTWSNYIYLDNIAEPKYWEAVPDVQGLPNLFLQDMLDTVDVETVPSVIDVGYIADRGWAIIETNEAYASGLYGCDPQFALEVMQAACVKT